MKLHTDTLTRADVFDALCDAGLHKEHVWIDTCSPADSRSRRRAFNVHLSASPGRDRFGKARRASNSGRCGATGSRAATYDEWGLFIAQIFEQDPDAIFGPYKGHDHFHAFTNYAYA